MSTPEPQALDLLLARLYRRNLHTIKLGLDAEVALLKELQDPHRAYLSIHVAGTNGKGSVCAMLASILQAAGLRVGLYTSPHLVRFNERIRVNGAMISDAELVAALDQVEEAALRIQQRDGLRDVTFFEFTTALAFHWFREQNVQVAVVETGMGGRLDATNVVTPVVSVITSIGLDHQAYLGNTLEQIAAEKAGIIKPGRPVIIGTLPQNARAVVEAAAHTAASRMCTAADGCMVTRIEETLEAGQLLRIESGMIRIDRVRCPLLGAHQRGNIAVAVATALTFADETALPVSADAIRAGLGAVHWPARMQVISRDPPLLVDGAHNPQAMQQLRVALEELRGTRPVGLIASFLADKDAAGCLSILAPLVQRCWLVERKGERGMTGQALRSAAASARLNAECLPLPEALQELRQWATRENGIGVIAGSLYLAGEALAACSVPI